MLSKCDCLVFCIVNTLNLCCGVIKVHRENLHLFLAGRPGEWVGKTREDFSSVFGRLGENLASKD